MQHLLVAVLLCALWPAQALAEPISIHSVHPKSARTAVLDDDGKIAYMYLTQSGTETPVRDAVVYSRVPLIPKVDWEQVKKTGEPPPLSADVASPQAIMKEPKANEFSFRWSLDGHSVALLRHGKPIALASARERLGYSKAVAKPSPLANPWDQKRYVELMGPEK